jgi:hypothetical protein
MGERLRRSRGSYRNSCEPSNSNRFLNNQQDGPDQQDIIEKFE